METTPLTTLPKPQNHSIVGRNLLIFLGYFTLFLLATNIRGGANYLGLYFYGYLIHALILLIFSIGSLVGKRGKEAGLYFLMAIMIPIIGFGACALAASAGWLQLGRLL